MNEWPIRRRAQDCRERQRDPLPGLYEAKQLDRSTARCRVPSRLKKRLAPGGSPDPALARRHETMAECYRRRRHPDWRRKAPVDRIRAVAGARRSRRVHRPHRRGPTSQPMADRTAPSLAFQGPFKTVVRCFAETFHLLRELPRCLCLVGSSSQSPLVPLRLSQSLKRNGSCLPATRHNVQPASRAITRPNAREPEPRHLPTGGNTEPWRSRCRIDGSICRLRPYRGTGRFRSIQSRGRTIIETVSPCSVGRTNAEYAGTRQFFWPVRIAYMASASVVPLRPSRTFSSRMRRETRANALR